MYTPTKLYTFGEHLGATAWPQDQENATVHHPEFDERRELRDVSQERLREFWVRGDAAKNSPGEQTDTPQHSNNGAATTTLASSLSTASTELLSSSSESSLIEKPISVKRIAAGFTTTVLLSDEGECCVLSNPLHHDFTPLDLSYLNAHYFFEEVSCGYRHAILVGEVREEREQREAMKREAILKRQLEERQLSAGEDDSSSQDSQKNSSDGNRALRRRPSTHRLVRTNSNATASGSSTQRRSPSRLTRDASKSQLRTRSTASLTRTNSKLSASRTNTSLMYSDTMKRLFSSGASSKHRSSGTNLLKMKRKQKIATRKVIIGLGSNEFHQMGFKVNRIQQSCAYDVQLPPMQEGLQLVEVSCGYYHTLFLMSDHSMWSCGSPILEVYTEAQSSGYLKFEVFASAESTEALPIRSISAGATHNLAVALNGSAYSWGSNLCGQCALGSTQDAPTPTKILALQDYHIVKAAAGYYHSVFLSSQGDVFTCGDCSYGRIGRRSNGSTPMRVILNGPGRGISAGGYHTLVTLRDGSVYAMGHSGFGQCGVFPGQCTPCYFEPQQVSIPHHSTFITHCTAGGYHSVLLHEDTPRLRGKMRLFEGLMGCVGGEFFADVDVICVK